LQGVVRFAIEAGDCAVIELIAFVAIRYGVVTIHTFESHVVEVLRRIASWRN
jgi:hypothetical protein